MGITATEFTYIADLVRRQSAIVLEPGKEYLVESRLSALARGEGFASLEQFLAELRQRPNNGLTRRVVEAMTTNETSFFRDVNPFEAMKTTILPELARARAVERSLTIWCAASSSGQEPYSLAMIARELATTALAGFNVKIVATDLSTEILEKAKAGKYSQLEVNRGLPAPMLVKYFKKVGTEWQVNDDLRRMVDFRQMNLAETWPALPMADVIFLRNVLIYFDVPTKRAILGRAKKILRPDGYLFLGGAETTLNLDESYKRVQIGKAVCYKPGT